MKDDGALFETAIDTGNGHLVKISESTTEESFSCEIHIIPQFPGASIYNSVRSHEPRFLTASASEVTRFIDQVVETYLVPVADIQELQEVQND
jgi:hypothetical protein